MYGYWHLQYNCRPQTCIKNIRYVYETRPFKKKGIYCETKFGQNFACAPVQFHGTVRVGKDKAPN